MNFNAPRIRYCSLDLPNHHTISHVIASVSMSVSDEDEDEDALDLDFIFIELVVTSEYLLDRLSVIIFIRSFHDHPA